MPEATKTRLSINRRMRDWFLLKPMLPMTARDIRQALRLPPDTAITARIREIRNHKSNPMDIRCERVRIAGDLFYEYTFWPANTVLPGPDEQRPF
jgi:hypothetical protein